MGSMFTLFLLMTLAAGTGPDVQSLLVLDKAGDSLSFIDPVSLDTIATVPTGRQPHEMVVDPRARRVYVSDYGTRKEPGRTVTVIDIERKEAGGAIDLGDHSAPHGLALAPDGRSLYVTCEGSQSLLRISLPEGEVEWAVRTDREISHMVAITPDGRKAYVSNVGSGSVTVIDTEARRVLRHIGTGDQPEGIDVSPDGREVWVGNRKSGTISVINTGEDEVTETVECIGFPIRVKFTPDGGRVLVSCARAGQVAVLDARRRKEIGRIIVGKAPIGIVPAPDGKTLYVANTREGTVSIVDLGSLKVTGLVSAGKMPDGLGLAGTP
jgi:YVTN family beta-propeller protein